LRRGTAFGSVGRRVTRPENENPARASNGAGSREPSVECTKLFLVMRAPLVKRVGAIEVPAGTRARRISSLFAPQ
jgi:hypothetical protein